MNQDERITKLPQHVAIIMDGNGRWATKNSLKRNFGHKAGADAVDVTVEKAVEMGIPYLSLFAFSEENWGRPQEEVHALMALLVDTIHKMTPKMMKQNVKCVFIGERSHIAPEVIAQMDACSQMTAANTGLTLILAISYSGKWDILQAVNACREDVQKGLIKSPVTYADFAHYLATDGIPDPDLLIRTSGEERISNYMLWQLAYTELYFTPILWPDFRKDDFEAAIAAYSNRKRRFGKIDE